MIIKKFFYLILILFFLAMVGMAEAFSITPTKILLTIEPGKTSELFVEVENNEKQNMVFAGKVLGVRQDNEGRPVFLSDYTVAEQWVKPKIDKLSLKSGAKEKIYFTVQVPTSTPAGAYYLALVIQSVSIGGDVGLTGQIASLLNLENSGNIEVLLDGNLSVSNWRGREIFREKLNLGNKLLAHSFRFLQPELSLTKKSVYLPGLYQVKVDVSYGKTNQQAAESVYVWYWPVWSKIAGLILLFLMLAIFVRLGRIFRRRRG